jgi:hypothetical protein
VFVLVSCEKVPVEAEYFAEMSFKVNGKEQYIKYPGLSLMANFVNDELKSYNYFLMNGYKYGRYNWQAQYAFSQFAMKNKSCGNQTQFNIAETTHFDFLKYVFILINQQD